MEFCRKKGRKTSSTRQKFVSESILLYAISSSGSLLRPADEIVSRRIFLFFKFGTQHFNYLYTTKSNKYIINQQNTNMNNIIICYYYATTKEKLS